MVENLMFPIFESGDALPMCMFSEISGILSSLTMRSVFLLAILQAIRAGSSITQSQSEL
jgi:hypothetical protein